MIRYTAALLALVGMVAISGCGTTPKAACEKSLKVNTCNKLEGKLLDAAVDLCVEAIKKADKQDDAITKLEKTTTCIEKNTKYCEYLNAGDSANATKIADDCAK